MAFRYTVHLVGGGDQYKLYLIKLTTDPSLGHKFRLFLVKVVYHHQTENSPNFIPAKDFSSELMLCGDQANYSIYYTKRLCDQNTLA